MDRIVTAKEASAMMSIPTAKDIRKLTYNLTFTEMNRMLEAVSKMILCNSRSEYVENWTSDMIKFMKAKGYKFTEIVDSGRYTYCHMYIDDNT